MSSVFTPRSRSTSYSDSLKSAPTGPTTRTSVKKLAASEKWTADPPSMRSRSPNGVRTASNAIDPTTTRLTGGRSLEDARNERGPSRLRLQRVLGRRRLHRRPQEPSAADTERAAAVAGDRPGRDRGVRGGAGRGGAGR